MKKPVIKDSSRVVLYKKDSRTLESFLSLESVDLVISGPPYWQEIVYGTEEAQLSTHTDYTAFIKSLADVWRACLGVLRPGGIMAIWLHDFYDRSNAGFPRLIPFHADVIASMPRELDLRHIMIWDRYLADFVPTLPNGPLSVRFQYVLVLQKRGQHPELNNTIQRGLHMCYGHPVSGYKTTPRIFGSMRLFGLGRRLARYMPIFAQRMLRVLATPVSGDPYTFRNYLSECPSELANTLIKIFSKKSSTVLDPFMGSGTSIVEAVRLGRHAIGVDIEEAAWIASRKKLEKYGFYDYVCE